MAKTTRKRARYDKARAHGYRSYHPAEEALGLYLEIKERTGMTDRQIAEASGVSTKVISYLKVGTYRRVQNEIYRSLRVLRDSNPEPVRVLAIGAQRRIDGLARMGWPLTAIRQRVGFQADAVRILKPTDTIPLSTHQKINALYDELSMIPGPSNSARKRAEKAGKMPPLAWDEDTIDDPEAIPDNYGRGTGGRTPSGYIDGAKVVRRLNGDRTVHLNKYESAEVRRHLEARGIGPGVMERDYGMRTDKGRWKPSES